MPAEQAEAWGLIWRVVDDERLMDEAQALARHLATQPTKGLGLIKRALLASATNSLDAQLDLERDLQREAGRTEDYRGRRARVHGEAPADLQGTLMRRSRPSVPVAVIGAGTMGAGIAQVAAAAGHRVLLYDAEPAAPAQAEGAHRRQRSARAVEQGRLSAGRARPRPLGRITRLRQPRRAARRPAW